MICPRCDQEIKPGEAVSMVTATDDEERRIFTEEDMVMYHEVCPEADGLRDITMFPHTSITLPRRDKTTRVPPIGAAFMMASSAFLVKYDRLPNYDIVMFRGGTTTTDVVFEMWEEE